MKLSIQRQSIHSVPFPSLVELGAWMSMRKTVPEEQAARHWLRPGDMGFWYSRSSWSLAALVRAWRQVHGRMPRLWLPAYFCNGSLNPVERAGAEIRFVAVDRDMVPDWRLIDDVPPPDLVLAPHIFGQPMVLQGALDLCRDSGAELIEDCAHALMPGPGLGESGAYVLWSPHKVLAVEHGGLLVRRPHAKLPSHLLMAQGDHVGWKSGVKWSRDRLANRLGLTRGGKELEFGRDPDPPVMAKTPCARPSMISMVDRAAGNLPQIASHRLDLATRLAETLSRLPGWVPLFPSPQAAPYRLVMRCDDHVIACRRFSALWQAGLVAESWPDMPSEVRENPKKYGAAMELRQTLVCLQIHQSIKPEKAIEFARRVRD